jgi:hypothetical protein
VADGRGGSAVLKSARTVFEIREIVEACQHCLRGDGAITREEFLTVVLPEIDDAEGYAVHVHASEAAAIHLMKDTVDVRNTEIVLARAVVPFPRQRRKKLAA